MTDEQQCAGTVGDTNQRCPAARVRGSRYCVMHDPSEAARRRHRDLSRRGGEHRRARGPSVSDLIAVDALDLTTPGDVAKLVAAGMLALARLPFTEKSAHALAALASVARTLAEDTSMVEQLDALERALPPAQRPALRVWRSERPV